MLILVLWLVSAIPQKEKESRRRSRGKTISDAIKFVVTMTIVLHIPFPVCFKAFSANNLGRFFPASGV